MDERTLADVYGKPNSTALHISGNSIKIVVLVLVYVHFILLLFLTLQTPSKGKVSKKPAPVLDKEYSLSMDRSV